MAAVPGVTEAGRKARILAPGMRRGARRGLSRLLRRGDVLGQLSTAERQEGALLDRLIGAVFPQSESVDLELL